MRKSRHSTYGVAKPPYSLISLICMAINSSSEKMLTVREIFQFIMDRFPYYQKDKSRWQNSLRHSLSVNDCFIKIKNFVNQGMGSYWTVHPASRDMFEKGSTFRRRKKFKISKQAKERAAAAITVIKHSERWVKAAVQNTQFNQQTMQRYQLMQPTVPRHFPTLSKTLLTMPMARTYQQPFTFDNRLRINLHGRWYMGGRPAFQGNQNFRNQSIQASWCRAHISSNIASGLTTNNPVMSGPSLHFPAAEPQLSSKIIPLNPDEHRNYGTFPPVFPPNYPYNNHLYPVASSFSRLDEHSNCSATENLVGMFGQHVQPHHVQRENISLPSHSISSPERPESVASNSSSQSLDVVS